MAFHTNVFRGGEWVTETVDLHAVLKSQAAPKAPTKQAPSKAPTCGLLTRTVVESPLANSILPVRLRSAANNDIAFVGDHFIQICELREDGRLDDIIRKSDFGCRIRNACVIGSFILPDPKDEDTPPSSSHPTVKVENGESGPFGFSSPRPSSFAAQLPPQFLMVVLESGDTVFLFVRPGPDGRPEFVVSPSGSPRLRDGYPGFHLAVDPSSRYVALAGATDYFVVYELESHEQLSQSYLHHEPLNLVRSFRLRSVRGVIHKMDFLYPRPDDHHHIILLLVVVRNGKSRTVIYEWELGNDLKTVFAEEKQGHTMPIEHHMPLLLVPLTIESAFLFVFPGSIAVYTECLHGPPKFEDVNMDSPNPTANHRGRHRPLWVAWARGFRLPFFYRTSDSIFLAREDGLVAFVDLSIKEEDLVRSCNFVDSFPCRISKAFACLVDRYKDVLVLGSDSGSGGYWKIPTREPSELLGTLPNWAPVVDFATTDSFLGWRQDDMVPWQQAKLRKPDRVFATCEGGQNGSVTEYRYGLKAIIGLDLEYGAGMKQAWLLLSDNSPIDHGYLLLLSMPDNTAALLLSPDFSSASEPTADAIPYDLTSTTLALTCSGELTVQVTEQNIVLAAQDRSARVSFQSFSGLSNASPSDACILGDCIAVSAHTDTKFHIHIFKADLPSSRVLYVDAIEVDGEVTCLSLGPDLTLLAGIRKNGQIYLAHASLRQTCETLEMVNLTEYLSNQERSFSFDNSSPIEGIASIIAAEDTVLLGTRSGEVIAVKNIASSMSIDCEKFGTTTVSLSCYRRAGADGPTVLVSCDNNLVSVNTSRIGNGPGCAVQLKKSRVWPVDTSKPDAPPPAVQYATAVNMPSENGVTPVLMISGSRLLLAELHQEPGPVHRNIPVTGVPNRVIYCKSIQCLVAAVTRDDRPTLTFINPDTGEEIGRPTDQNGEPQPYASGLGKPGDRILALSEWKFERGGNVWFWILVSTKGGRLVVISTTKVGAAGSPPQIRYWTRFKREVQEPIYSVIGYGECVVYCQGQSVHWEKLDVLDRKLKPFKSYRLESPATTLRISNGKLVALTNRESLVVLDHNGPDEQTTMKLLQVDPWRRNGMHFIEISGPQPDESTGAMVLLADRESGVGGLWVPWQTPERECEIVLEAELGASIRRFRRGRTRPMWEQWSRRPKYGRLPATLDDAEILGISLNGALHHFTLLSIEAWRLLRFVQNLALASEEVCPRRLGHHQQGHRDGVEEDVEPHMDNGLEMHVDGDVLGRCLEKKVLERLVIEPGRVARLVELLGELDGGRYTAGLEGGEEGQEEFFRLAYDVLEYYLQPVL